MHVLTYGNLPGLLKTSTSPDASLRPCSTEFYNLQHVMSVWPWDAIFVSNVLRICLKEPFQEAVPLTLDTYMLCNVLKGMLHACRWC